MYPRIYRILGILRIKITFNYNKLPKATRKFNLLMNVNIFINNLKFLRSFYKYQTHNIKKMAIIIFYNKVKISFLAHKIRTTLEEVVITIIQMIILINKIKLAIDKCFFLKLLRKKI